MQQKFAVGDFIPFLRTLLPGFNQTLDSLTAPLLKYNVDLECRYLPFVI
jgi:hypothetical protein